MTQPSTDIIKSLSFTTRIDTISEEGASLKSLGTSVQGRKNAITVAFQYTVADYIYQPELLTALLHDWLTNSDLQDEPRRTAKSALCNAVEAWGGGMVTCDMNERTKGTKTAGVHVHYLTTEERKALDYQTSVKALASSLKKHGSALYDALALIEAENQSAEALALKSSKSTDKIKLDAVSAAQAERIAERKNEILAELMTA